VLDIGPGEFIVLAGIALFVIGPERLPKAIAEAGRVLRELRSMASGARRELTDHLELDPELAKLDLASLDPRQIVQRALLDDEDVAVRPAPARPQRAVADGERPPYDPDAT